MALIDVMVGGETRFTQDGQPYNVDGTPARMDADMLERRLAILEGDDKKVVATEYWEGDQLRHRSLHVKIKRAPQFVGAEAGEL